MMCPECYGAMTLVETWDSVLKLAKWSKYCCEHCGGTFEVKRKR